MNPYNIISEEAISTGRATDAYFERTEEALKEAGKNPTVVAEVTADQFTDGVFEVFSGLKPATKFLTEAEADIDVNAYHEGSLFDGGPVMVIRGDYLEFARLETSLLGFLSQASGIATAALEATTAAIDTTVLSFGARHMHPSIASVIERNALIGGVDGFSHVAAGDLLDKNPSGTMPHALMLAFNEDTPANAWEAFNEAAPENTPRIALCDTFSDEVVEVEQAVKTLGDDLDGVRLDTTSSRRGDFRHIIKEVRFKLEQLGREDVDIFISGGLTPDDIRELRDIVDGFGIGGYISNADPVDFSLDIVQVNDEEVSKRGKLEAMKEPYRDKDGNTVIHTGNHYVEESSNKLLQPLIRDGELVRSIPDLEKVSRVAQEDAEAVNFRNKSAKLLQN